MIVKPNARRDNWRQVRLPRELADKLDSLSADFLRRHEEGRIILPDDYCEDVPLHYVVARLVDHYQAHLERARRQSRKRVHTP